jgi:hypothetical protein
VANDPVEIANELNNVLAIILASAEIAIAVTEDPRVTFELREIGAAVLRAASITHRLAIATTDQRECSALPRATSVGARCSDVSARCWNHHEPV